MAEDKLEFPEIEVYAADPVEDAVSKLIKQTNAEINNKRTEAEQKALEDEIPRDQIFKEPVLLIEDKDILEFVLTAYERQNKGWVELTERSGLMPPYRLSMGTIQPYLGEYYTEMKYLQLKAKVPTLFLEAIPVLETRPAEEISNTKIKITIKRYAKKEGREKFLEEYEKQLTDMLNAYDEAKRRESTDVSEEEKKKNLTRMSENPDKDTAFIGNIGALLEEEKAKQSKSEASTKPSETARYKTIKRDTARFVGFDEPATPSKPKISKGYEVPGKRRDSRRAKFA